MLDRHTNHRMFLGPVAAMLGAREHELLRRLVSENGGRYGEVCGIHFDRLESKGFVVLHGQRGEPASNFFACSVTAKGKALLAQLNRTNGPTAIGHANGHTVIPLSPREAA
jgi:hypothetical protein